MIFLIYSSKTIVLNIYVMALILMLQVEKIMWRLILILLVIQAKGTECSSHGLWRAVNPEVHLDVVRIIQFWSYPVEDHEVVTEDSYILTLNRIPYGRTVNKVSGRQPVVFLQHGLLSSPVSWISNLPNNSLAFILADAGFDVWMGNSRGSTYSLKHATLSTNSTEYWAFSFDEMARYDLPASIDYIVKKTGQKIYYVGHSQGTLIGFLAFSTLPKLAQKVKAFYALAPIFYVQHIQSVPFQVLFQISPKLLKYVLGDKDFLPETELNRLLATKVCNNEIIGFICGKVIFSLFGCEPQNLNMSRIDVYVAHNPAGTSVQNILHYIQPLLDSMSSPYDHQAICPLCMYPVLYGMSKGMHEIQKILRAYDWGSPRKNMEHYNQPTPPTYSPSTMRVPTAIWSGQKDLLADPVDVFNLLPQICNLIYYKNLPKYSHLDFIWGNNVQNDIYDEIVKMISKTL
ncbi:lipase member J-like [Gracilinanus agilis]|uniref:lipase member J-like n=1 Tax=Gracilinanus agilis TaxID=191870 RepID=UPI001CFE7D62|nr:lipase member J-like [Gracilinanus agilis]